MEITITVTLVAVVFSLIAYWIWDRKRRQSIFQQMGIPGPAPELLQGNFVEMINKGRHVAWAEWTEKYGPMFGVFEGAEPILVVSDADMLKQILIRDFSSFHSRKPFPADSSSDVFKDIFNSHGEDWKRLRSIATPSFSAKQMKAMSPLINRSVDHVLIVMEDEGKDGKSFNIQSVWQRMTLEVIASCAFGIEINSLQDPDDAFLQECRKLFRLSEKPNRYMRTIGDLVRLFPSLMEIPKRLFPSMSTKVTRWLLDAAENIIKSRKESKINRTDFIQLMSAGEERDMTEVELTADIDNDTKDESYSEDVAAKDHPYRKSAKTGRKMTLQEMQANCRLFLLAGYETTSSALAFLSYELAMNPECQSKIQQEIDEHFHEDDPRPDYQSVQKLSYMDMCLNECLRLHPIGNVAQSRKCHSACQVGDLLIPAGMYVQVNVPVLHANPEHWGPEDVNKFVPERFLSERKQTRHPMAWTPFGNGPRNCLGMRFALMESKIAMVRLLKRYTICRSEDTPVPLPMLVNGVLGPRDGVLVKLIPRHSHLEE